MWPDFAVEWLVLVLQQVTGYNPETVPWLNYFATFSCSSSQFPEETINISEEHPCTFFPLNMPILGDACLSCWKVFNWITKKKHFKEKRKTNEISHKDFYFHLLNKAIFTLLHISATYSSHYQKATILQYCAELRSKIRMWKATSRNMCIRVSTGTVDFIIVR